MQPEILRVFSIQKRALVMVEPPGHFRRIRILKIDDCVFIAVKQAGYPRLRGAMGHSSEVKFRFGVEAFLIEPIEQSGGGGAIKTTVVEAQAYSGHERAGPAFLNYRGWFRQLRR